MPEQDNSIWMKMLYRYGAAMLIGMGMLAYLFVDAHHSNVPKYEIAAILFAGLLTFGGAFGIAVSLFFHLWHRKE
jgi:hypothetical protein